jgi:hypothetical protein
MWNSNPLDSIQNKCYNSVLVDGSVKKNIKKIIMFDVFRGLVVLI